MVTQLTHLSNDCCPQLALSLPSRNSALKVDGLQVDVSTSANFLGLIKSLVSNLILEITLVYTLHNFTRLRTVLPNSIASYRKIGK